MISADDSPWTVFHNRSFRCAWLARIFTTLGVQAQSIGIAWHVNVVANHHGNDVNEKAFLLGMVGLAQFAPLLLLTLFGGAVADRFDRRKIVLICLSVEIACALSLAAIASDVTHGLLPIFLIAVVFGASRAFVAPASSAMGPMLVPRELLPRAISWNSLGWQGASVLGPLFGGMMCAFSSTLACQGAAAFYVLAACSLLFINVSTTPVRQPGSPLQQIRDGIIYTWKNKIVLGAISLDLFVVLLGGTTALLPIFAEDVLRVGALGFGWLRAGPSMGAAVMALILSIFPLRRHAGYWMFSAVGVFSIATLVFAFSQSLLLSVLTLAVLGAADMISVYVRQSLVQIVTPDHMRGRVAAVSGLFVGGSNELGEFETGVVAKYLGPVRAVVFGGIGSLVVTGIWAKIFPALRKADRITAAEVEPPS